MADDAVRLEGARPQETPYELILRELLTALVNRTREGALKWAVDDSRTDSYRLKGNGWSLATRSIDGDGTEPFALLITDTVEEPVLEVRSTRPFVRSFRDSFGELHLAAAASAMIAQATPMLVSIVDELLDRPSQATVLTNAAGSDRIGSD